MLTQHSALIKEQLSEGCMEGEDVTLGFGVGALAVGLVVLFVWEGADVSGCLVPFA